MTGRAHDEALEAEIPLGGQLGWGFSPTKTPEGERRLMLAVLEDAVDCYRKGRGARDRATRLLFAETREWVDSTDGRALFSFESICGFLDIDAGYVRRRLRQGRTPCRRVRRDRVNSRSETNALAAVPPKPDVVAVLASATRPATR